MDRILRAEEMRAWDRHTIEEIGVPSAVLMERAALSVAMEVLRRLKGKQEGQAASGRPVSENAVILAGSGNNGGDGFACARILHLKGIGVRVLMTGREASMTEETRRQRDICRRLAIPIIHLGELDEEALRRLLRPAAVIVDAVLGTGLTREVTGPLAALFETVNALRAQGGPQVISIDIPSGVASDTGGICGAALTVDATVTIACRKPGLLLYPGAAFCGEVITAEIGVLPLRAEAKDSREIYALDERDLSVLLPGRDRSGNKGTFGKVLVIAGSRGMAGAAVLAAGAALRSGCGMVKVLTEEENRLILQTSLPEALFSSYTDAASAVTALESGLEWCDAVLMGPGTGTGEVQRALLQALISRCDKPLVLDADALNLLSGKLSLLDVRKAPSVYITPHVGEMSRLLGTAIPEIKRDLLEKAAAISDACKLTCLLKDARSVTATAEGLLFINTSGNSGMATAGSGDVLAGILVSLLAQGTDPAYAAPLAAYIHGLSGDAAAKRLGERFMSAGNIVESLKDVLY